MVLPGQRSKLSITDTVNQCENCTAEKISTAATYKVIGECDSMGCEWIFLCDKHLSEHDVAMAAADKSGTCDWCKTDQPEVRPHRDFEEGSNGPVYDVCTNCLRAESARVSEELGEQDWDFPDDDGDDDHVEEEDDTLQCDWPAGSEYKVTYRSKCWPCEYGDMFTKYFSNADELAAWELDQAQWARLEGNAIQGTVWVWDYFTGDSELHQL